MPKANDTKKAKARERVNHSRIHPVEQHIVPVASKRDSRWLMIWTTAPTGSSSKSMRATMFVLPEKPGIWTLSMTSSNAPKEAESHGNPHPETGDDQTLHRPTEIHSTTPTEIKQHHQGGNSQPVQGKGNQHPQEKGGTCLPPPIPDPQHPNEGVRTPWEQVLGKQDSQHKYIPCPLL